MRGVEGRLPALLALESVAERGVIEFMIVGIRKYDWGVFQRLCQSALDKTRLEVPFHNRLIVSFNPV